MAVPTLAEFMARVVLWPLPGEAGVINIHWTNPTHPGMGGKPFVLLSDFLAIIPWCNNHPKFVKDVYFCLSRQKKVGPIVNGKAKPLRNHDNSTHLRAIWLDVDVKAPPKGYRTLNDAIDAVTKFCADAKLPSPSALVFSGGGLHVYWFSNTPLTVAEWQPYANGLRALAVQHGLICDYGVTVDCARVLRVPGTFNHKTVPAKEVKPLALGVDYDFKSTLTHVPLVQAQPVTATVTPAKTSAKTSAMTFDPAMFPPLPPLTNPEDSLACGLTTKEYPPIDGIAMAQGCPFFLDALMTGGANHPQGLWNITILASTFFDHARKMAHRLSKGYSTYSAHETDTMFDRKVRERDERGLGWPSCQSFENEGAASFCKTCKHRGKIRSPLNLGTASPQMVAPPFSVAPVPPGPDDLNLPAGYCVEQETGYVGFMRTKNLGQGATVTEFEPIFLCKLSRAWAEDTPDALHFTASMSLGKTRDVTVLQETFASTQAICLTLSKQGVNYDTGAREHIGRFMSHYLAKLHAAQAARTAVPFGWWMDQGQPHGFAYAGKLFKDDKTISPCGTGDYRTRSRYMPKGTIQPWLKALNLVTQQHRPDIEAITAAAFAAPLMRFTGQRAGTLSAHSQTGSNKTTATNLGLAVWGNPSQTKETHSSSSLAVMQKMGDVRNLPLYWDDVRDAAFAKVAATASEITEGLEGSKLTQGRDQRDRGEWQTMLIICSNVSLFEHYAKTVKNNTAGIMRMLEFEVQQATDATPGRLATSQEADLIVQELNENFGMMGEKYARMLALDPSGVQAYMTAVMNKLDKDVRATSEERFWMAIAGTIYAGATLANQCGANFNEAELYEFLKQTYIAQRDKLNAENLKGGTEANTNTALTAFMKEYGDRTLVTLDTPTAGRPKQLSILSGPDINQKKPVQIHWCVRDRKLRFSRTEFYDFMDRKKIQTTPVMQGLTKFYNIKKSEADLATGTPYQGGKEVLIVIDVPPAPHWLDQVMNAKVPIIPQGQSTAVFGGAGNVSPPP